jgi:urea transport system ATP-binding protein
MNVLLQLSSVTAGIGGSEILRGVDLTVGAGEVVALLGSNGSGKTAVLRAIAGVLAVRSGSIVFGGRNITGLSPDERARAGLSYVPQGRGIFPLLTVEENLRLSLVAHHRKSAAAEKSLSRALTLFPALQDLLGRKGGLLSVGQQQQLALARAVLTDPLFVLLDEPAGAVDDALHKTDMEPRSPDPIFHAIKVLKEEDRLAMLLVDQNIDFCREIADRFCVMERGAIVAGGTIAELTDDVIREYLRF